MFFFPLLFNKTGWVREISVCHTLHKPFITYSSKEFAVSMSKGKHHHHHQSLFTHEIVSFYMVFLGMVFKTKLKYSIGTIDYNFKNKNLLQVNGTRIHVD